MNRIFRIALLAVVVSGFVLPAAHAFDGTQPPVPPTKPATLDGTQPPVPPTKPLLLDGTQPPVPPTKPLALDGTQPPVPPTKPPLGAILGIS